MGTLKLNKSNRLYWAINRAAAQDNRLSLAAKGMMFYMLSKGDGWGFRFADLVNSSACSKYATRKALSELRDAGYLSIERDVVDGKFVGSHYVVNDEID
jgi:hypothetical protein